MFAPESVRLPAPIFIRASVPAVFLITPLNMLVWSLPPTVSVEVPEAVPVGDDLREELDRRLASYYADPSTVRPWTEIKAELFDTK